MTGGVEFATDDYIVLGSFDLLIMGQVFLYLVALGSSNIVMAFVFAGTE